MTESMKDAMKGKGGGLQAISSSVADTMGNAMDTRGSKQKKADAASSDLNSLGKSTGPTVEGSGLGGDDQVKNQAGGSADHLDMRFQKT